MLCYRCGAHVKDGSDKCPGCGQPFVGTKPGSVAGFGAGSRRHRVSIEGAPCKPGDTLAGRFQVRDAVGAGPLGWIFRAQDTSTGDDVALKVLSPRFLQTAEERASFLAEARKAQALDHPNIARVWAAGVDGDRPWVASQLLEGLTLQRITDLRRQKGQGFALREVEPIVAQMAAALDAAAPAFAHGCLKPDNVVVLPDLLKLTDFGLATSLPRVPFLAAQKATGAHRFLAPEFVHARVDARGDVWALGVLVAEMLSGAPWEPGFDLEAKAPGLPAGLAQLVRRATAPRPEERFAGAVELSEALTAVVEGGAAPARAPAAARAPEPPAADAGEDDVVIESAQTDPRVRIARALAAQEAAHLSEKVPHQPPAFAAQPYAPQPFEPSAPPPAVGAGARGRQSEEEVARVAASVGATPELLTAETVVKAPPVAPAGAVAGASASAAVLAPAAVSAPAAASAAPAASAAAPAAASAGASASAGAGAAASAGAPAAASAGAGAAAPAAAAAPAEEETAEAAATVEDEAARAGGQEPERRRGRRGRRGRKEEARGRRGLKDPEWAGGGASATAIGAQTPALQALPSATVEEVASALGATAPPQAPPVVAAISPARAEAPSFGAPAQERRVPVPLLTVGGLLLVMLVAWGVGQWGGDPKAEAKAPEAAKASAATPAAAAPDEAAKAAAAKAEEEARAAKAAEQARAAKVEEEARAKAAEEAEAAKARAKAEKARPAKDDAPPPARKGKGLVERIKERREARRKAQEEALAEAERQRAATRAGAAAKPAAPAPAPAPATAPKAAAPAPAPAPKAAAPAPAPTPAAAAAAAAPLPSAGAIAGLGDDELMAAKDPARSAARASAELAAATGGGAAAKGASEPPRAVKAVALAAAPTVQVSERACPNGTRLVPASGARVGTPADDDLRNFGDRPLAAVEVKAFCIDLYEWPNEPGKLPKLGVPFAEAESSCRGAGKRLCSEDEWEKACKGPQDLRFPYGAAFDPDACNTQDKANAPRKVTVSGAWTRCRSGYGLFDLSGNLAEWTASAFEPGTAEKAVKGGSAARPSFDDRCSSRRRVDPGKRDVNVGFRCCADAK